MSINVWPFQKWVPTFVVVLSALACFAGEREILDREGTSQLEVALEETQVLGAPVLLTIRYLRGAEDYPSFIPNLSLFGELVDQEGVTCLLENPAGVWFEFGGSGRARETYRRGPGTIHVEVGDRVEVTFDLYQLVVTGHNGSGWDHSIRDQQDWSLTCTLQNPGESVGVSSAPVQFRFHDPTPEDQVVLETISEATRRSRWFPRIFYSNLDPRTLEIASAETKSLGTAQDIVSLTLWAMESPFSCISKYEAWMKEGRDLGFAGGLAEAIVEACHRETRKRDLGSSPEQKERDHSSLGPADAHKDYVRKEVELERLRDRRSQIQEFQQK